MWILPFCCGWRTGFKRNDDPHVNYCSVGSVYPVYPLTLKQPQTAVFFCRELKPPIIVDLGLAMATYAHHKENSGRTLALDRGTKLLHTFAVCVFLQMQSCNIVIVQPRLVISGYPYTYIDLYRTCDLYLNFWKLSPYLYPWISPVLHPHHPAGQEAKVQGLFLCFTGGSYSVFCSNRDTFTNQHEVFLMGQGVSITNQIELEPVFSILRPIDDLLVDVFNIPTNQ